MNTWMKEYADQLLKAMTEHPDEYAFEPEMFTTVVERMRIAFARGSYNKDGRAIKATCKALGVKYTYEGINRFIANHV